MNEVFFMFGASNQSKHLLGLFGLTASECPTLVNDYLPKSYAAHGNKQTLTKNVKCSLEQLQVHEDNSFFAALDETH